MIDFALCINAVKHFSLVAVRRKPPGENRTFYSLQPGGSAPMPSTLATTGDAQVVGFARIP
ncbi:hypothetical protein, partial [Novipirellula maiorica]|uniref:hypothetical protein n=1 Tax=Novipirellula maiorica TaxID=1265734 RepID=UPI001F35AE40